MVGLDDPEGPFQPRQPCDSVTWEHRALPNFSCAPALGTGLGLEEEVLRQHAWEGTAHLK